ncbi:Mannosylfructose-phosphate synthase [compost metagenome]
MTSMHVMIDAREAGPQPSGLARYTFNLLRGLARFGQGHRYSILTNHPELLPELHGRPDFELINPGVRIVDPREQVILPSLVSRVKPQIFHSPSMVAPRYLPKHVKRILTLHDTIPLSCPEGFKWHQRLGWKLYYAASIKPVAHASDRILTVSEWSKGDISRQLDIPLERISVVYNWLEEHFGPVSDAHVDAVKQKYDLPERFVFALGSHYRYKNPEGLLYAFSAIAPKHPDLKLLLKIGRPKRLDALVRRLGLQDRVKYQGFVPDDELPALYRAAACFAFPSFYEGFGLPPLEAMLCGTPVVASHASSIPEVTGEAALAFDPADTTALAKSLDRVLSDTQLADSLRLAGFAQATKFSVQRGIAETIALYQDVLGLGETPSEDIAQTLTPAGETRERRP